MKVKIYTAENEMDASITKGYLESFDVETFTAPGENSLGGNPKVNRGPNVGFDIFVEDDKSEEAIKILAERDLK